jgi:hypothetical protein
MLTTSRVCRLVTAVVVTLAIPSVAAGHPLVDPDRGGGSAPCEVQPRIAHNEPGICADTIDGQATEEVADANSAQTDEIPTTAAIGAVAFLAITVALMKRQKHA